MSRIAYIAGPVSGHPDGNRRTFAAAEAYLTREGWAVINPLDHEKSAEGIAEAEQLGPAYRTGPIYHQILRDCFRDVLLADAVFLLPQWQRSVGAARERALATWAGIDCRDIPVEALMRDA
jgi:hypothetical protein